MSSVHWLFDLALILYTFGMIFCGGALLRPGGISERVAWVVLPLACLVHGVSFAGHWYVGGSSPMHSLLGAFSLYGLLCFAGALRFAFSTGSIVVAFCLGAIPYACLLMTMGMRFHGVELRGELPPSFLTTHLFALMVSFSAFSLAAAAGALLLAVEMALKEKRFGPFWESLPPLEMLDRETYREMVVGFVFLTAGIGIGAVGAPHAWGGGWFHDTRLLSTLLVWAIYGGYLVARARYGWRGRKLALFSVGGFAFALVAYVLVNMGKYLL